MSRFTLTMRRLALVVSTLIAAATVPACGSSGSTATPAVTATASGSPAAISDHNAADMAFVDDMIPHHRQAVTMAGYAATRASSPQVKALASQIANAQAPEIITM